MDTGPDPKRNLFESHPEDARQFILVIRKHINQGIEVLEVKSENQGMPLPEIILIVETLLEKLRDHYKGTLAGMRFKT